VPEGEADRPRPERGQIVAPEDADHARRVGERRDPCEQLRLDGLARDKQVDRLDAFRPRRLDEILALADEEAELRALAAAFEAADELQPRVGRRRDHRRTLRRCL